MVCIHTHNIDLNFSCINITGNAPVPKPNLDLSNEKGTLWVISCFLFSPCIASQRVHSYPLKSLLRHQTWKTPKSQSSVLTYWILCTLVVWQMTQHSTWNDITFDVFVLSSSPFCEMFVCPMQWPHLRSHCIFLSRCLVFTSQRCTAVWTDAASAGQNPPALASLTANAMREISRAASGEFIVHSVSYTPHNVCLMRVDFIICILIVMWNK